MFYYFLILQILKLENKNSGNSLRTETLYVLVILIALLVTGLIYTLKIMHLFHVVDIFINSKHKAQSLKV